MKVTAGVKLAWRNMSRNRLRTILMMAGVMVGICSLTVLDSVGQSTKRETMKRFKNMIGTFDTVMIRPGAGKTRGMVSLTNVPPTLKFEDADAIAAEIPEVKQVAQLQNAFDIDVKYRDRNDSPAIFGVSANWLDLRGDDVVEGDFVSREDVKSLARVAVLGSDVLRVLFLGEDPVGKTIRIGDVPFQVKGVLASRGAGPGGGSLDDLILIPVTTASKRLFNRDFLTMLIAQLRDPETSNVAVSKITALLRQRHHIAASALDDFTITNPQAIMAQVTQVSSTLSTILKGVAMTAML
ncbi:MAG TPA: ABC transporter permease, partial [Candidatus Acidoferrales bacterium]|nr:ABC transporter permease [Candidatus Acidoferrales bacterium]